MISTAVTQSTHTVDALRDMVKEALADPCVDAFHKHWYATKTTVWMTRWRGVPMMKCPMDLQVYHEMIIDLAPALIIETGTAWGGSASYYADTVQMTGGGRVVTVDVMRREPTVYHPLVTRLVGSSVDPVIVTQIQAMAKKAQGHVIVSLDSDHSAAHVAQELAAYAPLVTPGSFLVVEDTDIAGHPVPGGEEDGGPMKAVDAFLATHPEFMRDLFCERLLLTMHPGGWLRRIPGAACPT